MEKKIEEITNLDLMREFIKLTDNEIKPGEISVAMFMEEGYTRNRARYTLSKYRELGVLKTRKVLVDGKSVNAYSPKEGTWKDVVERMKQEE